MKPSESLGASVAGLKSKKLRGVATIFVCRTVSEAFATLQLDETIIRRSEMTFALT